jgi:hypothetical protein
MNQTADSFRKQEYCREIESLYIGYLGGYIFLICVLGIWELLNFTFEKGVALVPVLKLLQNWNRIKQCTEPFL